jgi:hypothetical protein
MRKERRLVAARFRLRLHVARRVAHKVEQVLAAALVADPAGDADV